MNKQTPEKQDDRRERPPEGKEGAGAHQGGKGSAQAGQTNKRTENELEDGSGARNYGPGEEVD